MPEASSFGRIRSIVVALGFGLLCSGLIQAQVDESVENQFPRIDVPVEALEHPNEEFRRISERILSGRASNVERRYWYEMRKRYWPLTPEAMPPASWKADAQKVRKSLGIKGAQRAPGSWNWTHLGPTDACAGDPPASGCPDLGTGRGTAIWVNPGDKTEILAGFADGGVWYSTDQGANWTAIFDFQDSIAVGSMTAVTGPSTTLSDGTIWVATGEGNFGGGQVEGFGVYRSDNGGSSWTQQTLPFVAGQSGTSSVRRIVVDPNDSTKLWAAADSGLFKTTDGGSNWTLVSSIPYFGKYAGDCWYVYWTDLLIDDSTSPSTIYVAGPRPFNAGCSVDARQDTGVFRSTDDGVSWTNISIPSGSCPSGRGYTCSGSGFATSPGNIGRITLINSESDKKHIYALVMSTSTFGSLGIWETTDASAAGTVTWTARSTTNFCASQCWYDMTGAVDPTDASKVLVGGLDAYVSSNNAATLSKTSSWTGWGGSNYAHADHHHAVWVDASTIYLITDGGFYVGNVTGYGSNGVTWTHRNSGGIDTFQFYGIAQHPSDAADIHGGLQDNGQMQKFPTGWEQTAGGDGGFSATDQDSPNIRYEEYVYAIISRSTNSGVSYGGCIRNFGGCTTILNRCSGSCVPDDQTEFIAPLSLDANNQSVLFTGSKYVYRNGSADTGSNSWVQYSPDLSNGSTSADIVNIHSAANNGVQGTLWAGTVNGRIWVTTGATSATVPSWTDTTASPLPGRSLSWISTDPTDGSKAIATFSGWGGGHVFRTTNGGTSWVDISGALPDEPFQSTVIDPSDVNRGFVGSDYGVYVNEDIWNTTTWVLINNGQLPHVKASMLEISPASGDLRVGTHGRGIWELTIPTCTSPTFTGIDSASDLAACADTGIQVSWTIPSDWGESLATSRSFKVYRDGIEITTGGCSGLSAAATSCIDDPPLNDQSYSYSVEAINSEGCTSDGGTTNAATDVPSCEPDLGFSHTASLTELCGDGDDKVEPGEEWSIAVFLANGGNLDASSAVATLSKNASSADLTIDGNPGSFGTVSQGGTSSATFTFFVDAASCGTDLIFDLVSISSNGGTYTFSDATAAVTIPLGLVTAGGSETGTQATTPLTATSASASSDLLVSGSPFSLTSADSATLSYSTAYATNGGTETADQASSSTVKNTIGTPVDLSPATTLAGGAATSATLTWTLAHGGGASDVTACARVRLLAPDTSVYLLKDYGAVDPSPVNLLSTYQTEGPGTYQLELSESAVTGCGGGSSATLSSGQLVVIAPVLGTDWDTSVQVELIDPSLTATVVKAYGVADSGSHTVTSLYTGLGNYQVQVTESQGATATLTAAQLAVTQNPSSECDVSSACAGPVEVSAAGSSNPLTLVRDGSSWYLYFEPTSGATAYNVYQDNDTDFSDAGCWMGNVSGTAISSGDWNGYIQLSVTPTTTADQFYLVTARDASLEGTSGYDSAANERSATACAP